MAARRRRGTKTERDKLKRYRKRFENAIDHGDHMRAEMHRAGRFYYNTRNEGQWEEGDRQQLIAEGRPCYAFNICKEKVDSYLGIYADAQRHPQVRPTGAEDELLAEVVDAVFQQVLDDCDFDRKGASTLKGAAIYGERCLQVEFRPHPDNPLWVEILLHVVPSTEINWDPGSIQADRGDAGYLFWDRWMSEDEFARWYPEHAKDFSSLAQGGLENPIADGSYRSTDYAEPSIVEGVEDDFQSDSWNRYYYDRRKGKARVIRYEFKTNVRVTYALDPFSQEMVKIEKSQRRALEQAAKEAGVQVELTTITREAVHVCEFIGNRILAEYETAGPFKGFSVSPSVYAMDEEEGIPFGALRNLFDPQMELNKANSLLIETIANGSAPGTIAEESAITDEEAFKQERRTPNGVAIVEDGALTSGAVKERESYPVSPAVVQRAQLSMELIDRISGIPSQGMVTPASQAEAATTVALRHHKSRQVVNDPLANFEWCIEDAAEKIVQGMIRSMPDDQFAHMLARDKRFVVQGGMVLELGPNPQDPQGQPVPVRQAELRQIEGLEYNLELEFTSDNTTIRLLDLDTLLKLQQGQVPVDPDVLVETATSSRSKRERLKAYVEETKQQQAQAMQAQSQQQQESMMLLAQNEMAQTQETQRANMAKESLQAQKQKQDYQVSLLEVWEKSDAAEKQALLNLINLASAQRREAVRDSMNTLPA